MKIILDVNDLASRGGIDRVNPKLQDFRGISMMVFHRATHIYYERENGDVLVLKERDLEQNPLADGT